MQLHSPISSPLYATLWSHVRQLHCRIPIARTRNRRLRLPRGGLPPALIRLCSGFSWCSIDAIALLQPTNLIYWEGQWTMSQAITQTRWTFGHVTTGMLMNRLINVIRIERRYIFKCTLSGLLTVICWYRKSLIRPVIAMGVKFWSSRAFAFQPCPCNLLIHVLLIGLTHGNALALFDELRYIV